MEAGKVKSVTITGTEVHGVYQNENDGLHTMIPANYPDIYKLLEDKGVNVDDQGGGFEQLGLPPGERLAVHPAARRSGSS